MKMKDHNSYKILFVSILLLSVSLACNFQGLTRQEPRDTIPVSTEAVKELQEKFGDALDKLNQASADVTITIDETELTSLVTFEVQKIQEPKIMEPQVYLRDGLIQIYAKLDQDNVNTPIQLMITTTADEEGYPQYEITSAKMGIIPFPGPILSQLKAMIDSVLSERMRSQTNQVFIRDVEISNGLMIIRGETR